MYQFLTRREIEILLFRAGIIFYNTHFDMKIIKDIYRTIFIMTLPLLLSFGANAQYSEKLNSNAPKELKNLAFTLGKWEFQWYHLDPNTKENIADGKSYSTVFLIHNGYTYCDDFFSEKQGNTKEVRGTTFRSFDPSANLYTMAWMVSESLMTNHMTGKKEDDKLIFETVETQKDQYGTYKSTITFYNIRKDSYDWKEDRLYDGSVLVKKATFYKAKRIK